MKYDKLADKINRKAWEKTKKDLTDDKLVEEVLNKTGLGLGITALFEGGRINIDLDKFKQAIELAIEAGRKAAFDELGAKKRVTIQTKYGLLSFDVKKKGVRA